MTNPAVPGDTRGDVLLRESLTLMAPLVRLLIAQGVAYPQFAQALKAVFLDAARAELAQEGRRATDSALSLLSGVHRKDVRTMTRAGDDGPAPRPRKALSVAAEVFGRWTNDPRWLDTAGRPRRLALRSRDPLAPVEASFEALAASISKDFHGRSVLDELLRLGVARLEDDHVALNTDSFVPHDSFAEMVFYLAHNVGDHLAAAAANVRDLPQTGGAFLENSVAADGLTADSARALHEQARAAWRSAFRDLYAAASERFEQDRAAPAGSRRRFRFGAYVYIDDDPGTAADAASEAEGGAGAPAAGDPYHDPEA